jgi:hypothetical protein
MKVLLLTHPRAGSTVYCTEYIRQFNKNTPYPVFEPYNIDVYKHQRCYDFLEACGVNTQLKEWGQDFEKTATKVFLQGLTQPEFIMKHMFEFRKHVNIDIVLDICKNNNVEIHTLYRENFEDTLVSFIFAKYSKIWHLWDEWNTQELPDPMSINEETEKKNIEYICNMLSHSRKNFFKTLNYLDLCGVDTKKNTYEKDILTKNFMFDKNIEPAIKKSMNLEYTESFLNKNEWIKELIRTYSKDNFEL